MFTIYITLKSFESYYIKKNTKFLKNLLLLTKNNTLDITEINIKEILQQGCIETQKIEKKRRLKINDKLSLQHCTSDKTLSIEKRGLFCVPWLFYASHGLQNTKKTTYDSYIKREEVLPENKNLEKFPLDESSEKILGYFAGSKYTKFSCSLLLSSALDTNIRRKTYGLGVIYGPKNHRPYPTKGRFKDYKQKSITLNKKASYVPKKTENLNIEIASEAGLEKKFNEINLPIKQKLFTVLRSVHVHKKSRLQFNLTWYIKKLVFMAPNIKIMFLILYLLKNAKLYGVEMEISLNHKTV